MITGRLHPLLFLACALCAARGALAQADASSDLDPDADAQIRQWSGDGISVLVKPLAADPVRAFLLGRGFASDRARSYASNCVFRVVLRYAADAPMNYDLRNWRIESEGGRTLALKPREAWMQEWRAAPPNAAARMGFEFSQLPTRQTLARGDTVLGMSAVALAPGSRFDLVLNWTVSGKSRNATVEGIRCRAP